MISKKINLTSQLSSALNYSLPRANTLHPTDPHVMLPTSATATLATAARTATGKAHVISVIDVDRELATSWKQILESVGFDKAVDLVIMLAPWAINQPFKKAISHAGFPFIFNGSKAAGHDQFSKYFKGVVLPNTKADAAKKTIGGMLTALDVNHVFDDKPHTKDLYLHPLVIPELLDEIGVSYPKVLEWRNANLTKEQLERADYTTPPDTVVREANFATPTTNQSDAVATLESRLAALTEQVTSALQGAAGPSGAAGRRQQLTGPSVPETSAASTANSPPAQAAPPAKRARA